MLGCQSAEPSPLTNSDRWPVRPDGRTSDMPAFLSPVRLSGSIESRVDLRSVDRSGSRDWLGDHLALGEEFGPPLGMFGGSNRFVLEDLANQEGCEPR